MTRFMASGKIGSVRQDYLTHVNIMLGRRHSKDETNRADDARRDGVSMVLFAEEIALEAGESLRHYPKDYPQDKRRA